MSIIGTLYYLKKSF